MAKLLSAKNEEKTVLLITRQELAETVTRMLNGDAPLENRRIFAIDISRIIAKHCNGRVLNKRVGPDLYIPDESVLDGDDDFWDENSVFNPLIESAELKEVNEINFMAELDREVQAFLEKYDSRPPDDLELSNKLHHS
jgi:hypothetical protein